MIPKLYGFSKVFTFYKIKAYNLVAMIKYLIL